MPKGPYKVQRVEKQHNIRTRTYNAWFTVATGSLEFCRGYYAALGVGRDACRYRIVDWNKRVL